MGNRMDKYNDSNVDNIPKRSDRNKELYRQIYNAYDEFENLVVPSNAKEIDLSTLKKEISSRDEYKKIKDYGDITNNKVIRKEIIQEEQKKENEIYDINELIKNAVKDNVREDIVVTEKEDYLKKLRLDNVAIEKEVNEDIDINEEELMKTANLSLDILSDLKGDNEDTIVSAVSNDEDDKEEPDSLFYSDKYTFSNKDFDTKNDEEMETTSDGKLFFKIFLCVFGLSLVVLAMILIF